MSKTKDTSASRKNGALWANTKLVRTRVGDIHCVKHDEFIGKSLQLYGEWAQVEIDRLLDYVKPGNFVLDIGANIGFHTLSFARRVGARGQVWAFEPDPVNGLLLRLNILNAGMENVVVPFDVAASDKAGLSKFRTYPIGMPNNFGHTAIDEETGDYTRLATPLDALNIERPPTLIKIDIEGHELHALQGMRALLQFAHPVLSVEAEDAESADDITAFLAELGYDVYDFVTNAFNPANFSGRAADVWNGAGRCANLLCVVPDTHRRPEDMPLRRAATVRACPLAQTARIDGFDLLPQSSPNE